MKVTDRLAHAVAKRYRTFRTLRRGANVCTDLATLLTPRIIFDVGANVGQSAAKFRRRFAGAYIHCFEPSAQSVARIRRANPMFVSSELYARYAAVDVPRA